MRRQGGVFCVAATVEVVVVSSLQDGLLQDVAAVHGCLQALNVNAWCVLLVVPCVVVLWSV
jgi:methylmalonyl-CoA mutase cobalamin-binding subunit